MGSRRERIHGAMSPKTKGIIIAVAALAVLVGFLALAFFMGWLQPPQALDPSATAPTGTGTGTDTVIHLVSGGDVNITDTVTNSPSYAELVLDVMPILAGADLTTLNFEGNIYGEPYGTEHSSAPQGFVQALRDAGVDVLQTANSKSVSNGILGLNATLNGIKAAGMQTVGTYESQEQYQRYQGYIIREIQGIRIAITAFTKGMDGRGLPVGSEYCVNLLYKDYNSTYQEVDEAGIKAVLSAMADEKPDITVALLHWGSEFNDKVSKTQESILTLMRNGGVDAVIGTHPHYVQKMGFEDNGMFVAYSLGDFCGDGDKAGTNYSVLLDLEITRDGGTGRVSITNYSYEPIYQYVDENGQAKLLRINKAITAYEKHSMDAVPAAVYEQMKTALTRIEDRVKG